MYFSRLTVSVIALLFSACGLGLVSHANPSPTPLPSATLVFATWVPDFKVTNGPEPGYKPAFTDLTSLDIQSASAAINSNGTAWVVFISFTPRGTNLFAKITRDNVAACPGDATGAAIGCPQRHVGIWLDLMQPDIDDWEDPTHTAKVAQPYDLGCLMHRSPMAVCPKLVSDPITLQEITGGHIELSCNCTQQAAKDLATAITSTRSS